jgi:hypothetical protein
MLERPRGREEPFSLPDGKPEREESGARRTHVAAAYYLDESDPDVAILRRRDSSFVAAFSASGATREGIIEAAHEDYLAGGSFGGAHEGGEEGATQVEGLG